MTNQPNKATVKGRLTTPWKKEMLPSFGFDIWSGERCICTMDDYPDAEKDADLIVESVNNHAELRERVKELEVRGKFFEDFIKKQISDFKMYERAEYRRGLLSAFEDVLNMWESLK